MIYLDQDREDYNQDIRSMIQAFYTNEKIVDATVTADFKVIPKKTDRQNMGSLRYLLMVRYQDTGVLFQLYENADVTNKPKVSAFADCDYRNKNQSKHIVHGAIYKLFVEYTGKTLPWGFLTGVRPTKLATQMLEAGKKEDEIQHYFQDTCFVTQQKADLCIEVAKTEQKLLSGIDFKHEYCLYIGIPFCPSKCLYCSFASYPIAAYADRVDAYLDALEKEMKYAGGTYADKRLISIYVGGGTPTSISAGQLNRLITMITDSFDLSHVREFTVEAGRPDSITREKLQVLKQHGIDRISINPQTMHDETLVLIGRAHTVSQTIDTFHLARSMDFQNINMDMIAGLPKENPAHVKETLTAIAALMPDGLTVHSLAIKRAADLNIQMEKYKSMIQGATNDMLILADQRARAIGMRPYYMYRQKNIPGNLENIGYSRAGRECLYNILIMEEKQTIVACGAGSITKRVFPDGKIERCENVKDVALYIEKIDEMIERKRRLLGEV